MAKKKKVKLFEFSKKRYRTLLLVVILLYIFNLQFGGKFDIPELSLPSGEKEVVVYDDNATLTFLDVGQGDSILIQVKDIDILIDAGEKEYGDDVVSKLKKYGVEDIEFLVATHPHSDHIGGMANVLENFEVENFVMPEKEHTSKTFEKMVDLVYEKNIPVIFPYEGQMLFNDNGASLKVISPVIEDDDNLNNYSICLKFEYGNTRAILTGDAEAKVEKMIVASGESLEADIYKVGHHGSATSSSEGFVKAINPQISVISVGKDNDYGHPHQEIVERLEWVSSSIYKTSELSDIRIITDGSKIDVTYGE